MDGNLTIESTPNLGEADDFALKPDTVVVDPTPKKRGRKPAPRDADGNIIREVKTASSTSTTSSPTKKTARKAVDVETFARQLVGIHQMIAKLPGMAAFEISADEAAMLAPAMTQCSEEYGVSVSPKTAATFQLVAVGFMVYAPRIGMTIATIKQSKKPRLPEMGDFPTESSNVGAESAPVPV